ncbi:uncharacterized protein LOC116010097 [Ipomoea triloba]|uniref:uncharacterized protein LOC116010097 n=1 Tax=Ipomoea triloba TaxID=35885 RepID=UPI00125DBE36|nr:uncharacterized protein LOC116010097 [Ipomoea triloba]
MAFAAQLAASVPLRCSVKATSSTAVKKSNAAPKPKAGHGGALDNVAEVLRKDSEFLKKGIAKGLRWANDAFRIPQLSKSVSDAVWLRNIEDPNASAAELKSRTRWPQPCYPELSGLDLVMADLRALEAYSNYFYCLVKLWTGPLPEKYDPQEVADYFKLRPHIVAFRLLEVFTAFASATIRFQLSGILPTMNTEIDRETSRYVFGCVLKETMLSLGPTFIKVGQSLSTRPDIIGSEISKALSSLHDQIPPFPRATAMKIIEEELGSPIEKIFSYISEEPVAAASFGQVYRGNTLDGFSVAVKVQRPDLRHVVVRDVYILRIGLGLLQKIARRKNDLRLYADELGKGLAGELDYTLEAANASEFMDIHSRFSFIRVPKVLPHLSRKRVLTMEWMVGESPTDLMTISTKDSVGHLSTNSERLQNDAKRRLLDLVNKGVEASLVQLIETGLLHADPHPGNLRYTSSGQIGFLDFGLLCRMEKKHQYAMLASIVHIVNGDWASLVQALCQMDVIMPGTDMRLVTMELEIALGEVEFKDGIPDVKFSRVLGKIVSVAFKYHFRMPPYYTLLLRSLASLEGLAVAADPNFKTFEAAYPYVVRKLLTDNSPAMRKILHSVVLNRRKEFQWKRLSLFLRVGATRKGLQSVLGSNSQESLVYSAKEVSGTVDVANLVVRLLPSKDGAVLRRLLMTADGASLFRAMVSEEANVFRQHFCRVLADVLYQWMSKALGKATKFSSDVQLATGTAIYDFKLILRDQRLKVIFFNALSSARKDPILMLRSFFSLCVIFVKASALACHRVLVSFSETYLDHLSFASRKFAMGANT